MANAESRPAPGQDRLYVVAAIAIGTIVAVVPHLRWDAATQPSPPLSLAPLLGAPGAPDTSTDGMRRRISEMETRLLQHPRDSGAAVLLADALLRQARVTNNGRLTGRASEVLNAVLRETPAHYDALRMLGAVYLSQHRFREALEVARRARDLRPNDAWNYGVIGDGLLELGQYDQAFDAFDAMAAMRPSAAAYARVAYARELRGDLGGALRAMRMASEATTAHDPEALAWYGAQVGELYFKMGKLEDADREYRRAAFMFPDHPAAMIGQGKVKGAQGDRDGALAIYLEVLRRAPLAEVAARVADLYRESSNASEAERYDRMAEDLAGPTVAR